MPLQSEDKVVCDVGECETCDELRTWINAGLEAGADPGQIMLVFVTMLQEKAGPGLVMVQVEEEDVKMIDALLDKDKGSLH